MTSYLQLQQTFSAYGVTPHELYELHTLVTENLQQWQTEAQDFYYDEPDAPYPIEYLHEPNQVLIHTDAILGKGRSSIVTTTVDFLSGKVFAYKTQIPDVKQFITLDQECALYEQFKGSPHVVQVVRKATRGILFEYMNCGDLSKYKISGPDELTSILSQVALAVSEVHKRNFVHRDIQRCNFLCSKAHDKPLVVKIGDLEHMVTAGSPSQMVGFMSHCSKRLVEFRISQFFDRRLREYTPLTADDLHALAIILYELETGLTPPFCATAFEIMQALERAAVTSKASLDPLVDKLTEQMSALCKTSTVSADILQGTLSSAIAVHTTLQTKGKSE
ncbi:MAG: protein kinase [Verrucomicrobia bacterium]|nr:protein kinase [Verrucomicrobiota bacterium]MBS0636335.1 protein kinase [Verrucomicrobiota bacterium]